MVERVALTEDQEMVAGKIITNLRRQPLKDQRAQDLSEEWVRASFVLSREIKDQIGILWMEKVMGVDEETVREFREDRGEAWERVGKLWNIEKQTVDLAGFWEGVAKVYHQLEKKDLEFLIKEDLLGVGAWMMICTFGDVGGLGRRSVLLDRLVTNAICNR